MPANVHIKYVDEVINVTDSESFEMSRLLGRMEGIFCGGSTGTNLSAALRVARDLDENAIVVFIVCDTGEHYLTQASFRRVAERETIYWSRKRSLRV